MWGILTPSLVMALAERTPYLTSRVSPPLGAYMRGSEERRCGNGRGGAGHGPDRAGGGQRARTLGAITVTAMAAGGCWRHLYEVLCKK